MGRLVIVSFDPGETTGYARLSLSKRLLLGNGATRALSEATQDNRVRFGQFGKAERPVLNEEQSAERMMMLVRLGWVEEVFDEMVDTFVVVVEDFILYRQERSRSLLAPVRLTARFEQLMSGTGIPIYKQSASDAKNTVTDARLRRWHMYDEELDGQQLGRHSRDALRHAILFARKFGSQPALRGEAGTGRRK